MTTVFHTRQWTWHRAYDATTYGFVRNEVGVCPLTGKEYTVLVHVPTELFQLLDMLLTDAEKLHAQVHGMVFYLDQVEAKRWVFGFEILEEGRIQDLWPFTSGEFPIWADQFPGR